MGKIDRENALTGLSRDRSVRSRCEGERERERLICNREEKIHLVSNNINREGGRACGNHAKGGGAARAAQSAKKKPGRARRSKVDARAHEREKPHAPSPPATRHDTNSEAKGGGREFERRHGQMQIRTRKRGETPNAGERREERGATQGRGGERSVHDLCAVRVAWRVSGSLFYCHCPDCCCCPVCCCCCCGGCIIMPG